MSKKDLFEIADTQSSAKKDDYKALIDRLLRNKYTISHQESRDERGLDQELLVNVEETVFNPPMSQLPIMRLEAREVFGYYNFDTEVFTKLNTPKFELKAFKKGAELHHRNDPWDQVEL